MASTKEQKTELIEAALQQTGCHYERLKTEKDDELTLFRFGDNGVSLFAYISVFDTSITARVVYNSGALEEDKITKAEFHDMVRIYESAYGSVFETDDIINETESNIGGHLLVLDTQLWLPQYDEEIDKHPRLRKAGESVVTTLLAIQLSNMVRKLIGGRSAITLTRDRVTGEITDEYVNREHLQSTAINIRSIDDGVLTTNYYLTGATWLISGNSYLLPLTLLTFSSRSKLTDRGRTDFDRHAQRITDLVPDFDGTIDYCLLNEEDDLAIVQAAFASSEAGSKVLDNPDMVKHAFFVRLMPHNYLDNIDRIFAAVGTITRGLRITDLNVSKHITENTSKWRTGTLSTDQLTVDAITAARPS